MAGTIPEVTKPDLCQASGKKAFFNGYTFPFHNLPEAQFYLRKETGGFLKKYFVNMPKHQISPSMA